MKILETELYKFLYRLGSKKASYLLQDLKVHTPPINAQELTEKLGLSTKEFTRLSSTAQLRIGSTGAEIRLRKDIGYLTRNFALAHEVVHFLIVESLWLKNHNDFSGVVWQRANNTIRLNRIIEQVCNRVAGEIVVPSLILERQVQISQFSIHELRRLSWLFKVTPETIILRMHQTRLLKNMIIVCRYRTCPTQKAKRLRLDWGVGGPSSFFPKHKSIPSQSSIHRAFDIEKDFFGCEEEIKLGSTLNGVYKIDSGIFYGKFGKYVISVVSETKDKRTKPVQMQLPKLAPADLASQDA